MYVSKQKLRYKVTQRGVSRSSLKSIKKKKMIILAINYRLVNKNRIDYLLALKFYYFVYLSIKLSLYRKLNIFSF